MPDIKLKPQMEKPKILNINRTPKEAGTILKEQYEAQKSERRPEEKSPVQYATDKVETTTRRGVGLAADSARRGVKRHRAAVKDRAAMQQQEQAAAYGGDSAAPEPGQGKTARKRGQKAAQAQRKAAAPSTANRATYADPHTPHTAAYGQGRDYSEPMKSLSIRERGRQKAIKDAGQARVKGRYLAEKENAAIRGLKQPAEKQWQTPAHIKQRAAAAKTGNAMPRTVPMKERLMTPVAVAAKKAKREAQKKMQRQMLKQAAVKAKKAAQETAKVTVRAAKAAARAIAAAAKAIIAAGGGVALLVVILLVALIGVIAASPFGIFFSGENTGPDAVPVSAAVAEINSDFNSQLETLQGGDYDDVVIHGAAADWPEVLAVFASKVAGADGSEAADVVTIDRDRINKLKAVFWDMTTISSYVQEIEHGDSDPDDGTDDSWTEYILHITITSKTAAKMPPIYGFTVRQTSAMNELLAQRAMLVELVGNLSIISADAGDVLENLPADLSPERKAVIKAACSLVGKVNYFWGGKSYVIGWDSRWGQIRKVWADGSSTTGTYRPYGMDCSGCATRS